MIFMAQVLFMQALMDLHATFFFFCFFFFFFFFWQDFECSSSSQVYLCDSPYYFGEGVCIVIPGISGIPEWIMDQNMGNHVTIDLPQDWYADKDFLGFALCSAYVPLDNKSEDDFEHGLEDKSEIQSENEPDHDEWAHKSEDESENGSTYKSDNKSEDTSEDENLAPCSLQCELTFHGDQLAFLDYLSSESRCECYENDGASGQLWVLYYPKVAIEEKYHSNKWRRLKASFYGFFNGVPVKVMKCGMQLIYAKNDEYNRLTLRQENLGDQRSTVEDVNVNDRRSCDGAQNTTQKNHSPIMQYTNGNDPGVQDDEQNHMPPCLNLLLTIVEWICCRRH